ncbi:uncharacterized protein [Pagrus major]|uniref:uncharacterized protein n=1 Tax=Pagrus major TaxID=143350 RepID=UPI003CC8B322
MNVNSFRLVVNSSSVSYRFRCPGKGVFQCESTGLVFVMAREAELLYRTVQWDENLLYSDGKMAAGLLFDIKCSEDAAVCQLHLPHCEVMDAPLPEDLLSVVHISAGRPSFLKPLEITDTHVVVRVSHFSAFGLVKDFIKWVLNKMKTVCGKVLLFLGQPNPKTQWRKLDVFLLPRNIHQDEVSTQQRYSEYIQVPSKCKLIKDQSYTLHCPEAIKIQPKSADFDLEFGPNYYPTFEVRLKTATEEVTLTVKDQRQMVVWEHDVDLTDSSRGTPQMNVRAEDEVPAEDNVPANDKLSSIRAEFVSGVSGPVLNQLLDKLYPDVINNEEMQLTSDQKMSDSVKEDEDEAESPGSSRLSVKADGSKDHVLQKVKKRVHYRERSESAESGYVSMKRNWSPYTKVHYNRPRSESGESDCLSVKTNVSKDHPPMFSNEPGPSGTKKYTVIIQRYRDDFCTLYSEYQRLHAQLKDISTKLQNELEKQVQQLKEKKKYLKIQKTYPNYTQERKRLEDLHNKMENIKRSIAMYDLSHLRQFLPLGSHPGNVNRAPPDRREQHPSTSESDLPVSDNIREESKEVKVEQMCPDDPERSNQQHQLLCGEAQNTNDKQHFLPELLTESGKTSYR